LKDATIHVNARKEAGLYNLNTNDYLELDFYIPSHHIAFEFQVALSHLQLSHTHSRLGTASL